MAKEIKLFDLSYILISFLVIMFIFMLAVPIFFVRWQIPQGEWECIEWGDVLNGRWDVSCRFSYKCENESICFDKYTMTDLNDSKSLEYGTKCFSKGGDVDYKRLTEKACVKEAYMRIPK